MIRVTDTPLEALKRAGFNTILLEPDVSQALIDEAIQREFYIVPSLPVHDLDPRNRGSFNGSLPSSDDREGLGRYLRGDRGLFWTLGGGRTAENLEKAALTPPAIRDTGPQPPLGL